MPARTSSDLTTTGEVVVQPAPNDGEVRVVATGTFTGLQGKVQGSLDGTNYVDLAVVREDTGALATGTLNPSATPMSFLTRIRGWAYVRFHCTQLSTGTATIDVRTAPTFNSPAQTSQVVNAVTQTITSTGANALAVGPNGTTNPAFNVDASASSAATGLNVAAAAAGSGLALSVLSSGAAENLTLDAKGSGTVKIGSVSTGNVVLGTTGHLLTLNNSTGAVTLDAGGLTLTTGSLLLSSGTGTITSNSATAFTAGRLGATTPAFQVDASTATSITGVKVKSAASGGGVAVSAVGETNVALTLDANGSGTITIGGTSTGAVRIGSGTNGPHIFSGTLTAGGLLTCGAQIGTSGPVIYSGSGAPSISAAVKGSLYLRSDGSSTTTRAYIATDTAGTWTALTTAA
jgi:hypothetical protein